MKSQLILILFLIPIYIFAQDKKVDLSGFEKIDLEEKYRLMNKLKSEFAFYSENDDWPENYSSEFHFIDLDNDSDYDLIYDGWSGSEPMMVNIFLNRNGDFRLILRQFISIDEIEIIENTLQRMVIHNPGCCGAIMEHWYTYNFISTPDNIKPMLHDHFTYHCATTKPEKLWDNTVKFKVINSVYTLRITPEIDNEEYYYPDDSKGNQLKSYTTGDSGIALAEQKDSTGRIWWYVAMDNKEKRNVETDEPDFFPPKYVGWMSSKFLEEIK
ncbi:MAG: hypothetical protein N4A74_17850 [Carboxylicivirga sp.]|jgi:hypothetical protein|nr:hypothetical protein [Carboxylicivirga sp.]